MGQKKRPTPGPTTQGSKTFAPDTDGGLSRRDFLKSTTAGLVAGAEVAGTALAEDFEAPGQGKGAPPGRRILLSGESTARSHRDIRRLLHRLDRASFGRLEDDRPLATDPRNQRGPVFVIMAPTRLTFLAAPTRSTPQ